MGAQQNSLVENVLLSTHMFKLIHNFTFKQLTYLDLCKIFLRKCAEVQFSLLSLTFLLLMLYPGPSKHYSNALAFVTRCLVGYTVRNSFAIINYVTFCWVTCDFMNLASLQFETKLQKGIRMGINVFKIFI